MNWICKTLLVCLSFNPVMDYKTNDEFIEQVSGCALHLNSMYSEEERVPVNLIVAQAVHEAIRRISQ